MDGSSSASFRRVIFHKLLSHQVCCGNFCDICENNLQSLDMKSLTLVLRHESLSWRECWRRFCPGNGLSTRLVILSVLKERVATSKGTLIQLKFLQIFPSTMHFWMYLNSPISFKYIIWLSNSPLDRKKYPNAHKMPSSPIKHLQSWPKAVVNLQQSHHEADSIID